MNQALKLLSEAREIIRQEYLVERKYNVEYANMLEEQMRVISEAEYKIEEIEENFQTHAEPEQ